MKTLNKSRKLAGIAAVALAGSLASSAIYAGNATVYIGHGIPGEDAETALGLPAGSLDPSLPVDVAVNGNCLLTGFTLAGFAGPFTLAEGTYTVSIHPADTAAPCTGPAVIGPADIPVPADANATVFAHLTADGALGAGVFPNDISRTEAPETGRLALHHTAAAPTVDVVIKRKNKSKNKIELAGVSNGDYAAAELNNRMWMVGFYPTGSDQLVYASEPLPLSPNTLTQAYAIGSLSNGTFEVITNELRLRRN